MCVCACVGIVYLVLLVNSGCDLVPIYPSLPGFLFLHISLRPEYLRNPLHYFILASLIYSYIYLLSWLHIHTFAWFGSPVVHAFCGLPNFCGWVPLLFLRTELWSIFDPLASFSILMTFFSGITFHFLWSGIHVTLSLSAVSFTRDKNSSFATTTRIYHWVIHRSFHHFFLYLNSFY